MGEHELWLFFITTMNTHFHLQIAFECGLVRACIRACASTCVSCMHVCMYARVVCVCVYMYVCVIVCTSGSAVAYWRRTLTLAGLAASGVCTRDCAVLTCPAPVTPPHPLALAHLVTGHAAITIIKAGREGGTPGVS